MSLRKSCGKGDAPRKYSKRVFDKNYGDIKWLSKMRKQDGWLKRIVKKILPICFILFLINDCYGYTNTPKSKVDIIIKQCSTISWGSRDYKIKTTEDIEKVSQSPKETLDKKVGNCCDIGVLVVNMAKKYNLKAEYKIVNNGKHVVVVITEGVKTTTISNGRKKL